MGQRCNTDELPNDADIEAMARIVCEGLEAGAADCGLMADAGMPTFVLTNWVRDHERGKRLVQRVDGYRYTIKSGVTKLIANQHTGELPGRLVRGGQRSSRL